MKDMDTSDAWNCPDRRFKHKCCGECSKAAILKLRRVMTMQEIVLCAEIVCEIERGLGIS